MGSIARKVYYYVACPPGGVLSVDVGGIRTRFRVHDLEELRWVELDVFKEKEILERLAVALKKGDTVYDVGANVGLYSVILAEAVGKDGRVVAFEPVREYFCRLQENVALNGLSQVLVFQEALSDQNGEIEISVVKARSDLPVDDSQGRHEVVSGVKGDGFREASNLQFPTLVKVDVEGSEYAVLRGLRETLARSACKLLMVEIHPQLLTEDISPDMILGLIESLGFTRIERFPCEGRAEYHVICRKA